MAEYDSDLEGKAEEIIVHNEVESNTQAISKKRRFSEMEDDNDRTDNNDSCNHSATKKQKLDSQDIDGFLADCDDEDSDEDDSDSDEEYDDDITLVPKSSMIENVEFELKDMNETYYDGIQSILCATDWDPNKIHMTRLTNTIVEQEEIGGVLLSENSVFGFITLLSYKKYFEHLSLAHIRRFLMNKMKKKSTQNKFFNYFARYNIGLLLHERPINIPLELIPHIYDALRLDIQYATNNKQATHLSDEDIKLFKCHYIMKVVRCRWIPTTTTINQDNQSNQDEKEQQEEQDITDLPKWCLNRKQQKLVYEQLEDAMFVKRAKFQFHIERNEKVWNVIFVDIRDLNEIVQEMHDSFSV